MFFPVLVFMLYFYSDYLNIIVFLADSSPITYSVTMSPKTLTLIFFSEFSFTNIHGSQDCRGRGRAFL